MQGWLRYDPCFDWRGKETSMTLEHRGTAVNSAVGEGRPTVDVVSSLGDEHGLIQWKSQK
jgi:hypothetical protein